MPISLVREDGTSARIPISGDVLELGSGAGCDVVTHAAGVQPLHARIRLRRGEYLLSSQDGAHVLVNGRRVPMMPLRHGDVVHLGADAGSQVPRYRFETRMADAFVPPGASLAEAWVAHPAYRAATTQPDRWGEGRAIDGHARERVRRVTRQDGLDIVVKVLGRMRSVAEGDRHLRVLQRLAGATHPAVATTVDGGLAPGPAGEPVRWMAAVWVPGTVLTVGHALVREAGDVVRVLARLAAGLSHLHGRGLVHGDVAPGNAVVDREGRAAWIDVGQARCTEEPLPLARGVLGTPGYVAPEAVLAGAEVPGVAADVYGLAALGYALLTGRPPAQGEDVLETLARASACPPALETFGVAVPAALEAALAAGLDPDAAARPRAEDFVRVLAFAAAELGVEQEA